MTTPDENRDRLARSLTTQRAALRIADALDALAPDRAITRLCVMPDAIGNQQEPYFRAMIGEGATGVTEAAHADELLTKTDALLFAKRLLLRLDVALRERSAAIERENDASGT